MKTDFSDHWVVEYDFLSDSFSTRALPDYLSSSQRSFHSGSFFGAAILAIHPTQVGARDECAVWQERRNLSPLSIAQRLAEMRPRVEALARANDNTSGS